MDLNLGGGFSPLNSSPLSGPAIPSINLGGDKESRDPDLSVEQYVKNSGRGSSVVKSTKTNLLP